MLWLQAGLLEPAAQAQTRAPPLNPDDFLMNLVQPGLVRVVYNQEP